MAMICSVCSHQDRTIIDRCLASGQSMREIAGQYGFSKSALSRHMEHVVKAVRTAAANRTARTVERAAGVWEKRLNETYDATVAAGPRYLGVAAKLCETGLRLEGLIEGGGGSNGQANSLVVNIEHVLVMPAPTPAPSRLSPPPLILNALAESLVSESSDPSDKEKT